MIVKSPSSTHRWSGYFVAFYFGSYFLLRSLGTYDPPAYGGNGIKLYGWYPKGFAFIGPAALIPRVIYAPLWALDRNHWHTREKSRSDRYPRTDESP